MNTLKIMVLYPEEMNIYGDHGNLLVLQRRAEKFGFKIETILYEPGMKFDETADIILGGGGQDSGQSEIQDDLKKIGPKLKKMAKNGTPMLVICGLYQLFGKYFETTDGEKIMGIGVFDAHTIAGATRLIGNIVTSCHSEFDSESRQSTEIIGYENHSGLTYLAKIQKPFAKVLKGAGNNGKDKTEGAISNNVYGSYLHGPILPKNPKLADKLIEIAVIKKYGKFEKKEIPCPYLDKARKIAKSRPR